MLKLLTTVALALTGPAAPPPASMDTFQLWGAEIISKKAPDSFTGDTSKGAGLITGKEEDAQSIG
jgi:hypothetical protein